MIYRINKQHYDEIYSLVEKGELKSIEIISEIKTIIITINNHISNENIIIDDFVYDFLEFKTANDFYGTGVTISFKIKNDKLLFKNVLNIMEYTFYDAPIDYKALFEVIKPTLIASNCDNIDFEDLWLTLELKGNAISILETGNVDLKMFNKELNDYEGITISDMTKQVIINYIHKWAIGFLWNKHEMEYYELEIDHSVSCFDVVEPITIDLEVIES